MKPGRTDQATGFPVEGEVGQVCSEQEARLRPAAPDLGRLERLFLSDPGQEPQMGS